MQLDSDIIVALHEEQRRLLPRLIRRRAARDWKRLQRKGRPLQTITDGPDGSTHWLVAVGLNRFCEMAACGQDVADILYDDDDRLVQGPVSCVRCLRLLKRIGGELAYLEQAVESGRRLLSKAPAESAAEVKPVQFREFL